MATWPAQLQQKLLAEDFSLAPEDTVIRTNMDYGPAKARRRYTDAVENVSCSIFISYDIYNVLEAFYKTTLAGGSLSFDFTHPIKQTPCKARFKAPYQVVPLGGIEFKVSMQWEILPS